MNFNFHLIVLQWFVLLVEYLTLTQRLVKIVLKVVTIVIVWTRVHRVETQAYTELMLLDLPVLMTANVSMTWCKIVSYPSSLNITAFVALSNET